MALDSTLKPPPTPQRPVREELHSRVIVDPYRWLEDGADPEVAAWVRAQNAYTESLLSARAEREVFRRRLAEVLAMGVVAAPVERGGRYFHQRRSGAQNQPVLYVRDAVDAEDRVLLDPNVASESGVVALDWWYVSRDGRLLAYGYSQGGDEKSNLRVLDVASGEHLPDEIPYTRYASLAWEPDGAGFYYTRYPAPGSVPEGEENYHQHVFHHRLGDDPANDPDVFGAGRDMTEMLDVDLSPDGRWLSVFAHHGWARNEVHVCDLRADQPSFQPVVAGIDALFSGRALNDTLYLETNWQAPRGRVIAVNLAHPERERWRELVSERSDVILQGMAIAGERLVLHEVKDVVSHVGVYTLAGEPLPSPELPPLGSVVAINGRWDSDELFIGYQSYTVPSTVLRYDLAAGELSTWAAIDAPIDMARFEVRQVTCPSKDGTQIPMFIVTPRDLALDGDNPTVLGGYGGFNVSLTPMFVATIVPWLERGGVYAIANLRGGSEYGEDWHRAGMLGNKQNVFDDFIAAAEYLVAEGYTRPERLAISGGSNGGLLVGATMVQRPDLCQAVVCRVPLLDMLRYHHYRIAKLWVPEYGSSDDAEQFEWLYAYSPYHHVTPGAGYPAVYFATAESDSRVDPMHALKMAALLQSSGATRPVLLHVETEAGHGQGKPLTKTIREEADVWTFVAWQLGVD
ncbi:MAG: prolyl oligopeptidase family serine peptidase [Dehalococcoidia bacterium]